MRTEEAILQATMRLLATRGIQGTSLDLLAEEVGVAKSSILWHFGSKEELLLRVAERVLEEVARGPVQKILALPHARGARRGELALLRRHSASRTRAAPGDPLSDLRERRRSGPSCARASSSSTAAIREMYETGLRGVVPDAAQRRRLAIISIAALDGIFLQWLLDPDAIDLEALHDELRTLRDGGPRAKGGRSDGCVTATRDRRTTT